MRPERWRRLEDLFELAIEHDPHSRADFLARECADDPELRREVEEVLRSHDLLSTGRVPEATLPIGSQLGRYVILSLLGVGGMGEVYRARDPQLSRDVGIKILPAGRDITEPQLERFEREARAVGALNHSNILTVYDIGVEGGVPYVVSELLEGETLRARLDRGPLSIAESLDLALQIASGLTAAHDKDLVHRDIKPENLFITSDGAAKILDFGLAKHTSVATVNTRASGTAITEEGLVFGTAAYMSPEQARGERADPRSDVFALGVVLYEMLAGRRPFSGGSAVETLNAILTAEPPPLPASVPVGLQTTVRRCLAKDPRQRYSSTRALASDLGVARVAVPRVGARRRGTVAVALVVFVALTAAVLWTVTRPVTLTRGASGRPSLAVLPLDDRSSDPTMAWMSEGLPRMLATSLAQTPGVDVIGSERLEASFRELQGERSAPPARAQVAKHAGAGAILVGALFKIGNEVRIDVHVEDVGSGRVVAAGTEQGADVFALVDRLTMRLRAALDVTDRPAGRPVKDVTTSAIAAYELYDRGLDAWHNRRWADARTIFEEAVRIDPEFALARAQLALLLDRLGESSKAAAHREFVMQHLDRLPERQRLVAEAKHVAATDLTRARAIIEQLLARYPDEEEGYDLMIHAMRERTQVNESLAFMQRWERAIPGPGSGHFHNHYGYTLLERGLFTEAEREFRAYIRVSPDEANAHDSLAELFLVSGRPDEAIRNYDEALRINPLFGSAYMGRAYAHAMRGRYDEAIASMEKLEQLGDRSGLSVVAVHLVGAYIRSRVGRYQDADARIETARAIAGRAGDVSGQADADLLKTLLALERGLPAQASVGSVSARHVAVAELLGMPPKTPRPYARDLPSDGMLRAWQQALAGERALAAGDTVRAEQAFRSTDYDITPNFGAHPALIVLVNNLPFRDGVARALAARGDLRGAIDFYRRLNEPDVAAKQPSLLEPRFILAQARLADRAGDRALADAHYARFLDLWKHADAGLPELAEARRK
jgi:tetratricopeptide (TPR) repeat protein/TolB-like protein